MQKLLVERRSHIVHASSRPIRVLFSRLCQGTRHRHRPESAAAISVMLRWDRPPLAYRLGGPDRRALCRVMHVLSRGETYAPRAWGLYREADIVIGHQRGMLKDIRLIGPEGVLREDNGSRLAIIRHVFRRPQPEDAVTS